MITNGGFQEAAVFVSESAVKNLCKTVARLPIDSGRTKTYQKLNFACFRIMAGRHVLIIHVGADPGLNIVSNYAANVATRYLTKADSAASSSLAKLSAGIRVLSAKDDAASLAICSRLNAEVQAQKQAKVNTGQATSILQIAEGTMSKVNDILVRMKTLAVQSSSSQLSGIEHGMFDTEYQALTSEIDPIAQDTEFKAPRWSADQAAPILLSTARPPV